MVSLVGAREDIATTPFVTTLPIAWRFKRRATQLREQVVNSELHTHCWNETHFKEAKTFNILRLSSTAEWA